MQYSKLRDQSLNVFQCHTYVYIQGRQTGLKIGSAQSVAGEIWALDLVLISLVTSIPGQ